MEQENSILHDKLKEYFGFTSFKGNQEAVIRNLLAGRDTFVLMPTGGGKSLCYQLPALLMDGVAIIISPLIALMKNQVDAMRTFSTESGIAHFLNSSLNKAAITQVRNDVLAGKTKLLYFAPESLTKEDNVAFLRKIKISFDIRSVGNIYNPIGLFFDKKITGYYLLPCIGSDRINSRQVNYRTVFLSPDLAAFTLHSYTGKITHMLI